MTAEAQAPERARRSELRVVVADDDDDVRAAVSASLDDDHRFAVIGDASDAATAVAVCRRLHPDVAIIDIRMPGGGVAAATGIRAESPETVVVALSAHTDRASVAAMLDAGAAACIPKVATVDVAAATWAAYHS